MYLSLDQQKRILHLKGHGQEASQEAADFFLDDFLSTKVKNSLDEDHCPARTENPLDGRIYNLENTVTFQCLSVPTPPEGSDLTPQEGSEFHLVFYGSMNELEQLQFDIMRKYAGQLD